MPSSLAFCKAAFKYFTKMKNKTLYLNMYYLTLTSIILLFSSCKDDIDSPGDGPTYTITGKLYQDCSMQSVANQAVDLFQEYSTGVGGLNGGILAQTTTDVNGKFTFNFKDMDGFTESIRIPAGQGYTKLLENIPQNQSISNIDVFISLTSNIQISLQVSNTYTSSDTLFITDFRNLSEKLKVAGPFLNGTLYTAINFPILNKKYTGNGESLGYKINNGNWIILPFTFNNCDTTIINVPIN